MHLSRINRIYFTVRHFSVHFQKHKPPWNVLFFGTDNFSLASLKALNDICKTDNVINNLEIVTTVKKKLNVVYKFANKENLKIHAWPLNMNTFSDEFDVGLVVSFGYLIPQNIINKFPLGMLNVHASLLPRWRGAAPIIHAIANGDSKTGITIMRIKPKHFDIGEIIDQASINIEENITMPVLYERLAELGAKTLVQQLYKLPDSLASAKPQPNLGVTLAPKVTCSFGTIDWSTMSARKLYNLSRALTGLYPLLTTWNGIPVKLYDVCLCSPQISDLDVPGSVLYDKFSKMLRARCVDDNWISIKSVGVQNKRTMSASDFNNGYLKKVNSNNRIFK